MRTHTKFGIKIFEIDMLMIFDLLTLLQGVFYHLFVRTHTKFGIKIFEIDMLMIFDL